MDSNFDSKKEIRYLLQQKSNSFCADCFDPCALYVDLTIGVFICQNCSKIHKKFGYIVKNTVTDDLSFQEIEALKQFGNQTINQKFMAQYESNSTKIPFGASFIDRQSFLTDKYITKVWYSEYPSCNFNDFNPHQFRIQEHDEYEEDQLTPFASSTEPSEFSEISSPIESSYFNFSQKQKEIITPTIHQNNFIDTNSNSYRSSRVHHYTCKAYNRCSSKNSHPQECNHSTDLRLNQMESPNKLVIVSINSKKKKSSNTCSSNISDTNSYSNSSSRSNPFDSTSSNSYMNSVPNPFKQTNRNAYKKTNTGKLVKEEKANK